MTARAVRELAERDRDERLVRLVGEAVRAAAPMPVAMVKSGMNEWVKIVIGGLATFAISIFTSWNLVNYRLGEVEKKAEKTDQAQREQEKAFIKVGNEILSAAKNAENSGQESRKVTDANTTTIALIKAKTDQLEEDCKKCGRSH